jgi:hypothetical protein
MSGIDWVVLVRYGKEELTGEFDWWSTLTTLKISDQA